MSKASTSGVISHWYHLVENFNTSGLDFYAAVETAVKARQVPDLEISRVEWSEGGVLSAKREYLRVQRGKLAFDICAAPFGTGFFFSWWLAELGPSYGLLYLVGLVLLVFIVLGLFITWFGFFLGSLLWLLLVPLALWALGSMVRSGQFLNDDIVLAIPIIGPLYERVFRPNTYYKMDTALMFQEMVRLAVNECVDALTSANGIRALSDMERKPILKAMAA